MNNIKIGFAPTRRSIFSAPDVIKYVGSVRKRLEELGIEFVDTTDISGEGLLYNEGDRLEIEEKFRREGIDGLFFLHCNFGTKYVVARMAQDLSAPTLFWGPRDERPDENGVRLRSSQCGLSATGEVLHRSRVLLTCMTNCRLEDAEFERGIRDFLAVCNVVRVFRSIRVLQITPRPSDFWSTMCNEGGLLERFNIQLAPIPMPELTAQVKLTKEEDREVKRMVEYCHQAMDMKVKEGELENITAMKVAMKRPAVEYGCNAVTIQYWDALQDGLGIMSCVADSLSNKEGPSAACETDVHGVITAAMVKAAAMDGTRGFFASWTAHHPDNENGELPWHCDSWSISVAREKLVTGYPLTFDHPGIVEVLAKYRGVALARFDGDNGKYPMLMENAEGIEGLYTKGIYLRMETENLKRLEDKLVCGLYIHHCVGIHKKVVPMLYEACKYTGAKPDLYNPIEEEVKAYIRGE